MRTSISRKLAGTAFCLACAGVLAVALRTAAQPYSASRALRPLTRDGVIPPVGGQNPNPAPPPESAPEAPVAPPARPVEIVAKIDAGLAASKINVVGRVDGIKGTMFVTNLSRQSVSPAAVFAVCDSKGAKIGAVTNLASALEPDESGKIVVTATNVNAVDFKLLRLSAGAKK